MKIEDITGADGASAPDVHLGEYGAGRNAIRPEIAALLNARVANMLFNCRALARDEIELANFIVNKLDVDPHYLPSETLLQAIRSINRKLASDSPLQGVIRTA
ncbi:hypothetical protein ACW5F0_09185 [Luteimonas sp. A534]